MLLRKHNRTRENSSGNKWTPSYYGEWTNGITLKLWIYRPILRQLPPWNLFSRSLPTAWNYEPHVNASHWWNDMKIVNAADTNLTAANTGVRNVQLLFFSCCGCRSVQYYAICWVFFYFMCLDLRSRNHFAKSFCFVLELSSKSEVSAIRTPRTETCISGASARSQYPGQGLVVQRGSRLQYMSKGPGLPVAEARPVWAKGFGLFTSRLQRRIERYVT